MNLYVLTSVYNLDKELLVTEDVKDEIEAFSGTSESLKLLNPIDYDFVMEQLRCSIQSANRSHAAMRRDEIYYANGKRDSYTLKLEEEIRIMKENFRLVVQAKTEYNKSH